MVRIETWFNQDLKQAVKVQYLDGNVFSADNTGNVVGVNVFSDGQEAPLTGTVSGSIIRADGVTVAVSGFTSWNKAYIILPQAAYVVPGVISIVIKLVNGTDITTLCAVVSNVYMSTTDTVVDPGTIIPDVNALIAAIDAAVASIPPDYSQLWEIIAPTFSTGTSYANGQYVMYDGSLYRFIADHPAGTWNSNHALKVSLAPDVYDNKKAYENNVQDVLLWGNPPATFTGRGVTATAEGKNRFHFAGTISGSAFFTYYENLNALPYWLKPGETYCLSVSGASNSNVIYFEVLGWRNGTTQVSLSGRKIANGVYVFTIPSNFVGGAYVRIGWLGDNTGTTVNETIEYHMLNAPVSGVDAAKLASVSVHILDTYSYASCDDIHENVILFIESRGGVLSIPDAPYIGYLQTYYLSSNVGFQIAYPWNITDKIVYRMLNVAGWSVWQEISGGDGTTTIVQEVSRDTYNNTYNINVSPQITTDSNGWLQPVDTDTQSETGKTDMTGAIMAMLNSTGYCHLAPGIFYVTGNIDMPSGSLLEGCGKQTIIRLLQSVTSGYIVRMHTKSTIKNICFSGGYSDGDISTPDIGGRKGVNYIGNRDGQTPSVTPRTCTLCMIDGCWFENLDSGIYGYNAGGGLQEGLEVCNCYFSRCKAGINLDYWTEYCKFTNCVTFQCYFACINNGGNNVFSSCTFHGVEGFRVDNSSNTKTNNGHGSAIGCTFNHIDNMNHPETLGNGYGVRVINTPNGFIFSNCQMWYGRVYVEDSQGVQFIGGEFGGSPGIEIVGDDKVFFNGCIFSVAPTVTGAGNADFDSCYLYSGAAYGTSSILNGKKNVQNPVSDPSASGNSISFISGITQDANGVITPIKKEVQPASTAVAGVVQLVDALNSSDATKALTAAQGKILNDNVTSLRYATSLGTFSSLGELTGALDTKLQSMSQNESLPVWFQTGSSAVETIGSYVRCEGYLQCVYVSGTRKDATVIFTGNDGTEVHLSKLNGSWRYNDINANVNAKLSNVTFKNVSNVNSFTVDLGYTPTSSKFGQLIVFNANQGSLNMIAISNTLNVTKVIGNITLTATVSGQSITVEASGTMWGDTTIMISHN